MCQDNLWIRRVTAGDVSLIQYLAGIIWADTYEGLMSEEQQARVLRQSYSQESLMKSIQENTFLLAEVSRVAAGYVDMGIQGEVLYLHRLYVMPQFQRCGLGKQLLQKAIFQSIGSFPGNHSEGRAADSLQTTLRPGINLFPGNHRGQRPAELLKSDSSPGVSLSQRSAGVIGRGKGRGKSKEKSAVPKVVVATVETYNPKARGFYRKIGFIEESSTAVNMGGIEIPAIYIVMPLSWPS